MNTSAEHTLAKVPEVTLGFWLIKIAATTLGETGGDAVSMSMNLGYLVGTAIAAIFLAAVVAQVRPKAFIPSCTGQPSSPRPRSARRWPILRIVRSGSGTLAARACCWPCCSARSCLASHPWLRVGEHRQLAQGEAFYWLTIMFSQTLGTALGDWTADTAGLGYTGAAVVFGGLLALVVAAYYWTSVSRTLLFWAAFILTSPAGCRGRRLSGQAAERGRSGAEPLFGIGRTAGLHAGDPAVQAASSQDSTLKSD
jgi:hypothetical protein